MNYLISAYLILLNSILLLLTFIFLIIFSNGENSYFRVGPSDSLTLINININTQERYISTLICVSLLRLTYIILNRIGGSILSNSIYNPFKKKIKNTSRGVIAFLSSATSFSYSLTFVILVKIYITQFDYAIITITSSELIFALINYFIASKKKYKNKNNNNNSNLNIEILDVSTINPAFEPRLEFNE